MADFFLNTTLQIPMAQLILLMLFSTLALLFGKLRLALLINYIFCMHWAYFLSRDRLLGLGFEKFEYITLIYFLFGLAIVMVAAFSFLFHRE